MQKVKGSGDLPSEQSIKATLFRAPEKLLLQHKVILLS